MIDSTGRRSVLFICTANQCRSPMAEALLKSIVTQKGVADRWDIHSAGTWTEPGRPATALARAVMRQRQLDLSAHRSRPLDAQQLESADIVLVMTHHHQEAIQAEWPAVSHKIYLLSHLIECDYDIDDPYGGSLEDYELCAADLEGILSAGYARLVALLDQAVSACP